MVGRSLGRGRHSRDRRIRARRGRRRGFAKLLGVTVTNLFVTGARDRENTRDLSRDLWPSRISRDLPRDSSRDPASLGETCDLSPDPDPGSIWPGPLSRTFYESTIKKK